MSKIKKKIIIGGFIGRNQGKIENSFSSMNISKGSGLKGGFAAMNNGEISHCFSYGRVKNLSGGFIGDGSTAVEDVNCFLYTGSNKKESNISKLKDSYIGQSADSIKSELDLEKLGYDIETVFQFNGKEGIPVSFISDRWMYGVQQSPRLTECKEKKPLILSNVDEFIAFAKSVNDGDHEVQNAYVILNDDIDLKGREWKPIGKDKLTAFSGIFDGSGHIIKNLVIKDKKNEVSGLFGYLKGEVYNLTVDGKISGGNNIGGIAAVSEGGIIGCCASVVNITLKNGVAGGLVALNAGTIFKCYCAGAIKTDCKLGICMLPVVILLIAALGFIYIKPYFWQADNLSKFQKVPYDEDSVSIKDDDLEMVEGSNFVSFQFSKEVAVDAATGKCKFNFKNPGNSNHDVVIELQMTDAQAVRVMGSTGRTAKEQEKLEQKSSYDPETNRMVLAKSGAIAPGKMLENLTLIKQPNGAGLPDGTYNAVIYLYYYDVKTNARAMLDTQLPVVLNVSR